MLTFEEDGSELSLESELFRRFCKELNALSLNRNANWGFDGMSGGFKFSDECPPGIKLMDDTIAMPFISLMRQLWAFRISLVHGRPRADVEYCWNLTKTLAPNWPGFHSDRCSDQMLEIAGQCIIKSQELVDGMFSPQNIVPRTTDSSAN